MTTCGLWIEIQGHGSIDWVVHAAPCSSELTDECVTLWIVNVREEFHQVDGTLDAEFLCLPSIRQVETWRIVDWVDLEKNGLVRELLTIACSKCNEVSPFTSSTTVLKRRAIEFNGENIFVDFDIMLSVN